MGLISFKQSELKKLIFILENNSFPETDKILSKLKKQVKTVTEEVVNNA